ncbi:MAG: type I-E CRISPR-associated protein Cas6/Cse3/CasE [Anaerolineaceae bacterium]
MYLSKILLDPASKRVQNEISNRYELHRTLLAQFKDAKREKIGLLYRLEATNGNEYQPITLLVQTQIAPDWQLWGKQSDLVNQAEVKEFQVDSTPGAKYYFRLLANPTAKVKQADGKGKRLGLYQPAEQLEWLKRKAGLNGFLPEALNLTDKGMVESTKKDRGTTYRIKHFAILYEGVLVVTDQHQFSNSMIRGIGSAKAFGFGLLSLVRV